MIRSIRRLAEFVGKMLELTVPNMGEANQRNLRTGGQRRSGRGAGLRGFLGN